MNPKGMPTIGDWYKNSGGDSFEVVACDESDLTIEIQYFDGAVEEIDFDSWQEMRPIPVEPPEDWSGSLDIVREDYGVDLERTDEHTIVDPLEEIERQI